MRSAILAASIVLGGFFYLVAGSLHAGFSRAIGIASLALLAFAAFVWPLVRRYARLFVGAGVLLAVYLQFVMLCTGLAAAAALAAPPMVVGVAALTVVAVGVRLRAALPAWEAGWEAKRAEIERTVLDLSNGTWALSRLPEIGTVGGSDGAAHPPAGGVASGSAARATAGRAAPIVAVAAGLGAVAASNGWGNVRVAVLAGLCPLMTVMLTALLVPGIVMLRRVLGYERRTGVRLRIV